MAEAKILASRPLWPRGHNTTDQNCHIWSVRDYRIIVSDGINADVSHSRKLIGSHEFGRCAGAWSCWKTTVSVKISRI